MKKPLAERMRPQTLADFVGQEHIIGADKPLSRMINKDQLHSMIFYGLPGTGKSTLASLIAKDTKSEIISINAVLSNVAELREAIKIGTLNFQQGITTILFIDEIHRFNKSQQDALLPSIEKGYIILVGSTTQNPIFYLNNALLSRVMLFNFKAIEDKSIVELLQKCLTNQEQGLGKNQVIIDNSLLELIAASSNGDVRKALTYLEIAYLSADTVDGLQTIISAEVVSEVIQRKNLRFDRDGDEHYDIISAFIKSVRGSDPDAAIYYLALMLKSGEDPRFIIRRLCILASEDIGLAEPEAMNIASSALNIVTLIGMPEAKFTLAECTIYLALCPKSNSARNAIMKAEKEIDSGILLNVPNYLRDKNSSYFEKSLPAKYKYAHDYPVHVVKQKYLEKSRKYYEAGDLGSEKEIKKRQKWLEENIFQAPDAEGFNKIDAIRQFNRKKFDDWFE